MKLTWIGLLFAFVFGMATTAQAQRDPSLMSSKHYVGIEAGINYSWLGGATNFFFPVNYPYIDDGTSQLTYPFILSDLG